MRRFLAISSLAFLLGGAQPAAGAPLTVTITFTLVATGADPSGLDGATVTLSATFADGTVYVDDLPPGGLPSAVAAMNSLMIAGATVGLNNGTFADPEGFVYIVDPFTPGTVLFDSLPPLMDYSVTMGSGTELTLGLFHTTLPPLPLPVVGDPVKMSDFAGLMPCPIFPVF